MKANVFNLLRMMFGFKIMESYFKVDKILKSMEPYDFFLIRPGIVVAAQ